MIGVYWNILLDFFKKILYILKKELYNYRVPSSCEPLRNFWQLLLHETHTNVVIIHAIRDKKNIVIRMIKMNIRFGPEGGDVVSYFKYPIKLL